MIIKNWKSLFGAGGWVVGWGLVLVGAVRGREIKATM